LLTSLAQIGHDGEPKGVVAIEQRANRYNQIVIRL